MSDPPYQTQDHIHFRKASEAEKEYIKIRKAQKRTRSSHRNKRNDDEEASTSKPPKVNVHSGKGGLVSPRKVPYAIPPSKLPVVSCRLPSSRQCTAPTQDTGPLLVNNHSVEEFQKIYHDVVDKMLRFSTSHDRPYNISLGRQIKHKLWKRLNKPTLCTSVGEDGRLIISETEAPACQC